MSHKSDVLEFVLCLGALFFFSSWLKLNLRQGRQECGLIEITEGSLHCFLPLSHLLWPLSPPLFFLSLHTWETQKDMFGLLGDLWLKDTLNPQVPSPHLGSTCRLQADLLLFSLPGFSPRHHCASPQQPLWQNSHAFSPIWTPQAARMQTVHPKTAFYLCMHAKSLCRVQPYGP